MRGKIAVNYEFAIREYCQKNNLSYDKIRSSPYCYDDEELIILHHNPEKGKRGLLDDGEPMPATLEIYLENGKLRFEQTDITHKYLGADKTPAHQPTGVSRVGMKPARPMARRRKLAVA